MEGRHQITSRVHWISPGREATRPWPAENRSDLNGAFVFALATVWRAVHWFYRGSTAAPLTIALFWKRLCSNYTMENDDDEKQNAVIRDWHGFLRWRSNEKLETVRFATRLIKAHATWIVKIDEGSKHEQRKPTKKDSYETSRDFPHRLQRYLGFHQGAWRWRCAFSACKTAVSTCGREFLEAQGRKSGAHDIEREKNVVWLETIHCNRLQAWCHWQRQQNMKPSQDHDASIPTNRAYSHPCNFDGLRTELHRAEALSMVVEHHQFRLPLTIFLTHRKYRQRWCVADWRSLNTCHHRRRRNMEHFRERNPRRSHPNATEPAEWVTTPESEAWVRCLNTRGLTSMWRLCSALNDRNQTLKSELSRERAQTQTTSCSRKEKLWRMSDHSRWKRASFTSCRQVLPLIIRELTEWWKNGQAAGWMVTLRTTLMEKSWRVSNSWPASIGRKRSQQSWRPWPSCPKPNLWKRDTTQGIIVCTCGPHTNTHSTTALLQDDSMPTLDPANEDHQPRHQPDAWPNSKDSQRWSRRHEIVFAQAWGLPPGGALWGTAKNIWRDISQKTVNQQKMISWFFSWLSFGLINLTPVPSTSSHMERCLSPWMRLASQTIRPTLGKNAWLIGNTDRAHQKQLVHW